MQHRGSAAACAGPRGKAASAVHRLLQRPPRRGNGEAQPALFEAQRIARRAVPLVLV
ncbi:hypothetical protein [Paracoccus sp. MC1862]|uniref:hypothetical protein n=1 Tax=Paracoccus sp. MC1862 TaxID=2760307 RepID=UPI0016021B28|nr:hypothetical protein [Paracoccus sp. MC1862]